MDNWLKNFYGGMTGMIVGACLENLPILEIRMMLLDYERLLFRASEVHQEFIAIQVLQRNVHSIVKQNQLNSENESCLSVNDTAATDNSFMTDKQKEKEIWENFFNSLDEI